MATGDQADVAARMRALLPSGWFGDSSPILTAVLNGIAAALAQVYSLIAYARLQTRIATATDGFLDLISFDFFGTGLPRKTQESDAAFRNRIQAEMLLERGTRRGLIRALELLTGYTPWFFEPARPADTGAYNQGVFAYNTAGAYGSLRLPYQAFCIAYRPPGQGIPYIAGYGNSEGAYGTGQTEYATPSMITGAVTDSDIYAAISSVKLEGTTVWARITNFGPGSGNAYTDEGALNTFTDESGNDYTTET